MWAKNKLAQLQLAYIVVAIGGVEEGYTGLERQCFYPEYQFY